MKVVYMCDTNYIKYLNLSVASLLHFNPNAEVVVVSDKPLNIKYKNIVFTPPESFLSQLRFNEKERLTALTYYKLLLPQLPDDKILYIDCDTLIQKPLDDLWNLDCPYIGITEHYWSTTDEKYRYPGNEKHAIACLMLMNLKALRADDFTNKCLQNMNYPQKHWGHDESLINLNYQNRLTYIDFKYCISKKRIYKNPINEKDAYILHYPAVTKRLMESDYRRICGTAV